MIFGLNWADEYKLFYLLFLPLNWIVTQHGIVGAAIGITVKTVDCLHQHGIHDARLITLRNRVKARSAAHEHK